MIRTRTTSNQKVIVRYDVEDLGAIWVFDSVTNDYLKVPCTEPDYADELTLVLHWHLRKNLVDKGKGEQNEKALLEHRALQKEKIDSLRKSKKVRDRQRSARLRDNLKPSTHSINAITKPADVKKSDEPFVLDDSLSFPTKRMEDES